MPLKHINLCLRRYIMANSKQDSSGRFMAGTQIEKICLNCERTFIVNLSGNYRKFCSHTCSMAYRVKTGSALKRIQKPCAHCGKPIIERPSRVNKSKYCSRQCKAKEITTKIQKGCPRFSAEFYATLSKIKDGKGKFCSHACWCKNRNIKATMTIQCKQCGKEFTMLRSNALHTATDNTPRQLFCSRECFLKSDNYAQHIEYLKSLSGEMTSNWQGGVSFLPYCRKFNKTLKEKIRNRDNRTCQVCGTKENGRRLDVHHIHYDKINCAPDLISLCLPCHIKANNNRDYWEDYFMILLRKRGLLI